MANINELTLKDKVYVLSGCIKNAKDDEEYASQSELGENPEETLNKFATIADEAYRLFILNTIHELSDNETKRETIIKYTDDLDECLSKFPEYKKEKTRRP